MQELASTTGPQVESPFADVQTPRLSILHLMLWTLCSAVYLSLMSVIYRLQGGVPSHLAAMYNASNVILGIVVGAEIMGAIVLVSTRVRCGPPMLRQPGHWFLFVSTVFHLTDVPVDASLLLLQESGFNSGFNSLNSISYVFPIIAYGFAARKRYALRWKLIFVGLAALSLANGLFFVGIWLSTGPFGPVLAILSTFPALGGLLLVGAVLVVPIVDLVAGERRDWLHWTGVAMHVAGSSVALLWMIKFRFFT